MCSDETHECIKRSSQLTSAIVKIHGFNINEKIQINGTLYLNEINGKDLEIRGEIQGLNKNSSHAIHVHETGILTQGCSDTGSHFNPNLLLDAHGNIDDEIKHSGDMGNLKTNEHGEAQINIRVSLEYMCLSCRNRFSILYRSLVVHINADDLGRGEHKDSKSNGNSGKRIACGLIEPRHKETTNGKLELKKKPVANKIILTFVF